MELPFTPDRRLDPMTFGITPAIFHQFRAPRLGYDNPTRMNNPVWEWLIRSNLWAASANKHFDVISDKSFPTWCFERFGRTVTPLPDGRVICIGGEHEDHYDANFFIYNDVVVIHPDLGIDIYGYPLQAFPATDNHSGLLIGNEIFVIGGLSYPRRRQPGFTPVFAINIHSFQIRKLESSGDMPGWIFGHKSALIDDGQAIKVSKGEICITLDRKPVENIDDWQLDLQTLTWSRLTQKNWIRWEYERKEHGHNLLWKMRSALFEQKHYEFRESHKAAINHLVEKLGHSPDLDMLDFLYLPPITHNVLPEQEDESRIYRIEIDDVVVRYVEDDFSIQVTVEGILSDEIILSLKQDLQQKLEKLENTAYLIRDI